MSAAFTLTGLQHAQVDFAPDATVRRDKALAIAARVKTIEDALDADEAAGALRELTDLAKATEADRKLIKEPVLELSRKIDATAKDFIASVVAEKLRIELALGTYQAAENEKAEQARKAAELEAKRLEFEANHAAAKAELATNQAEATAAQEQAAKAEVAAVSARVAAAQIVAEKPDDVTVRRHWKYEVTDINALFAARPDLCLIEPNAAAIRAQIPHNQNIPGLRIWREAKAGIR